MTDQGSAVPRFKAALIDALLEVEPLVVNYQSPISLAEALGQDGSGESVFWLDNYEASYELNVVHVNHLQFDEMASPTLVIQCVGRDTDSTQATLDTRAAEIQWQVFRLLGDDPTLGLTADTSMQILRAIPQSSTVESGVDSQNQRGVRIELSILVEARITAALT